MFLSSYSSKSWYNYLFVLYLSLFVLRIFMYSQACNNKCSHDCVCQWEHGQSSIEELQKYESIWPEPIIWPITMNFQWLFLEQCNRRRLLRAGAWGPVQTNHTSKFFLGKVNVCWSCKFWSYSNVKVRRCKDFLVKI